MSSNTKRIFVFSMGTIGSGDSNRRVDILALDSSNKQGYILDPTIRFEGDFDQAEKVNEEKTNIYKPCIKDLQQRYNFHHPIEVIGICIGARGTITSFVTSIFKKFKLPTNLSNDVALAAVKGSCSILLHHLYNSKSNN